MLTYYVTIDVAQQSTVCTGSLDECSDAAKRWAEQNPGKEYVYAKVVPIGVHCRSAYFKEGDVSTLSGNNIVQFPIRRELAH